MTKHQKRLSVPDSWPVSRKTNTFTIKAGAGPHGQSGVPIAIILRDVLGYVDTKNEAQYALNQGTVEVNGDVVTDERRPIGMFDILAFTARDEFYRVFPDEGGRMTLTAIPEEDAGSKLGKVIGKRQVSGGRTQLNLHDGANLIVEENEYGVGDSVVVDNQDDTVVAHFPYEEGALVTAVRGTHAGEIGELVEIDVTPGSGDNRVLFDTGDETVETIEEYVVVIDEQFAGDEAETSEDDVTTAGEADDEEVSDDE